MAKRKPVTAVSSKRTAPKVRPAHVKHATTRQATTNPAEQRRHEELGRAGYVKTATGYRSTAGSSGITSRNLLNSRAAAAQGAGDAARKRAAAAATKKNKSRSSTRRS